ncbi:BTAD domain-containing putative transcriptional regulator [Streptomyces sp. NPDC047022]|uniref:AfsR/SARP family transcriptional regulator n=1 Tax=Streptomyces sp. NPDC047022 TaxID=3155737 RepID=UPI0033E37054
MATQQGRFEFRLLGPLEAVGDGRAMPLGGPQVRGVLARLLVDLGRTVSVAALVDELWGERAPDDAHRTVRTYVSRLRRAMAGPPRGGPREVLVTRAPGYQLAVEPEAVDAVRFERLAAQGRQALAESRPGPAHELLTAALALWRGSALAEFEGLPAVGCEAVRLEGLRLTVVEDRIEAALAAGQHGPLVGELEELVRAHPVRERLRGQLMMALYRSGRQAEALGAFQDARSVLVDAYGVEPSPTLVGIHQRILRQEPGLDLGAVVATAAAAVPGPIAEPRPPGPATAPLHPGPAAHPADPGPAAYPRVPAPAAEPAAGVMPVPAQLPLTVVGFTARKDELAQLDTAALDAVPLTVISGTAGVGKTSLVVHWAHRVAPRFPDGQLYADLHGFDPSGTALDPADCLRGFLNALGLPPRSLPAGLLAQSALFRSMLAGKRVLVVLDNARDAEQVRPLLPGSSGCLVVVTSRDQLTPLVVAQGAASLRLDPLTAGQARDLLIRRLGHDRVACEPGAADEIAAHCAGLPLALAVAATRAAVRPGHSLSALSAQMSKAAARLDAFEGGDAGTDLRSVFSWSYRTLGAEAARLFRLLGLYPGPDLSAHAAASLVRCPVERARWTLAELCRANLLTEQAPGRYALHDLLRAYAAELALAEEDADTRRVAVHRVVDHSNRGPDVLAAGLHGEQGDVSPGRRGGGRPVWRGRGWLVRGRSGTSGRCAWALRWLDIAPTGGSPDASNDSGRSPNCGHSAATGPNRATCCPASSAPAWPCSPPSCCSPGSTTRSASAAWCSALSSLRPLERLLSARRLRGRPRVVKRRMSNYQLKRAEHRDLPQPARTGAQVILVTSPRPTSP